VSIMNACLMPVKCHMRHRWLCYCCSASFVWLSIAIAIASLLVRLLLKHSAKWVPYNRQEPFLVFLNVLLLLLMSLHFQDSKTAQTSRELLLPAMEISVYNFGPQKGYCISSCSGFSDSPKLKAEIAPWNSQRLSHSKYLPTRKSG
jgi:hypothetical protein